jgi:predicted transcriptional regulator
VSEPIAIPLDEHLSAQLDRLVELTGRPKTWHIEQALRDYASRRLEFLEAVEEGLRADEAGDVVDHAEVEAMMEELRQQLRVSAS